MLLKELSKALEHHYQIGKQRKERNALIQCFGIKYADVIKENNIRPEDIVEYSSLKGTTYAIEIRKGMKLSKYVVITKNI
jgi:hypothetical protein